MSKFIERLKQVSQPSPLQLGFRSKNAEAARPKIQLVAFLANSITEPVTAADAIVVSKAKSAVGDALWGVWFKKGDATEANKAIEAGADFTILPSGGAVLPGDFKIGKILQMSAAVTDVLLRTVNDLPVDAVLLAEDKETDGELTWQKLMLFQRFAGMLQKPVLVPVPLTATAAELQLIWETGVSGVMVSVKEPPDASALSALREHIDSLQFPARKKKDRLTPVLPQVSVREEDENREEPDDDD